MSGSCTKFAEEIAAAAGGVLSGETITHLESCESCAALRKDTLSWAQAMGQGEELSSQAAVAMARRALERKEKRKGALWIAPLLSASASAALLILHFGLATPTVERVEEQSTVEVSTTESDVGVEPLTPTLPSTSSPNLPASLSAMRDLLLVNQDQGGRS